MLSLYCKAVLYFESNTFGLYRVLIQQGLENTQDWFYSEVCLCLKKKKRIPSAFPFLTSLIIMKEREDILWGCVSQQCREIREGSIIVTIEMNAAPVRGIQRTDWTLSCRKAMGAIQWEWEKLYWINLLGKTQHESGWGT